MEDSTSGKFAAGSLEASSSAMGARSPNCDSDTKRPMDATDACQAFAPFQNHDKKTGGSLSDSEEGFLVQVMAEEDWFALFSEDIEL